MRLIDADGVMNALNVFKDKKHGEPQFLYGIASAKEIVEYAITVDAEPVRHGRWIKSDFLHIGANQYRCSECWEDKWWLYHFSLGDSNYCPNCGAKMDEVSE